MLSSMRGGKNQTLVWALLGLLILGLTGFGINGLSGGNVRSIGKVGDESIPVDTYARSYSNAVNTLSNQFGRTLSPSEIQAFGINQNVLSNVLSTAAVSNEANRLGISVGDQAVAQEIRATGAFSGIDGQFDKEAYEYALENAGVTAAQNEELIRKSAARSLVEGAIATGAVGNTSLSDLLLSFEREKRSFEWAALDNAWLSADLAAPLDEDLTAIYEASPEKYTAPLTREITYATMSPEDLEDEVTVSDEELLESYELQPDRFNKSARMDVDRIVFSTTQEAEDARAAIDAQTKSFDQVAADRGLEPEDAMMGQIEPQDVPSATSEVLFGQTEPGVYGPLDSDLGPALFRINGIFEAQSTPFEEAREELFAELAGEEARRMISDMLNDFDDLLAAGATLEELANDSQMTLGTISFSAENQDGIAAYQDFRTAAVEAQVGDFPELKVLDDGGIFALRVDEIKQPALRPFDEVKDDVIAEWERQETVRQLRSQADILKSQLETGTGFSSLQLDGNVVEDATRDTLDQAYPVEMIENLFTLDAGQVTVINGDDRVFIARLNEIDRFDGSTEEGAQMMTQVNELLANQRGSDIMTLFSDALQTQAGVSLNQAAINSIITQISGTQ